MDVHGHMMSVHIYNPTSHYIGQVRRTGARRWETVTGRCKTAQRAMAKAVMGMSQCHHRARVLLIDSDGWLGPVVVMECVRK